MNIKKILKFTSALVLISSINSSLASDAAESDKVLATYGNKSVTLGQIESVIKAVSGGSMPAGFKSFYDFPVDIQRNFVKNYAISDMVNMEATKEGFAENENMKKELEEAKKAIINKHYLKNKFDSQITEQKIKDEYKELSKKYEGSEERKVAHILVKEENEMKKIMGELKKDPKKFKDLAKQHTIDTASKESGGDLGYIRKGQMVPEFEKMAFETKANQMSEPFKTDFGWHIVMVEDVRKIKAPTFEEVKENIRSKLFEETMTNYVSELEKKDNLKIMINDTEKK